MIAPTYAALIQLPECERLQPELAKGRQTPAGAYRVGTASR